MNFRIEVAESALKDIQWFKKHERVLILDKMEKQLRHQPAMITRNRKALRHNILSRWELRIGKYRVFYNVDQNAQLVIITAVGYKEHNKLLIQGKEVKI